MEGKAGGFLYFRINRFGIENSKTVGELIVHSKQVIKYVRAHNNVSTFRG